MPWYVSAKEIKVPKVIGLSEAEAKKILEDNDLEPMRGGESYNENYPEGSIAHQKPDPGSVVKVGRRIFLFVSSGVPTIKAPSLIGKALRDAKLTLERMDLELGETTYVKSEQPRDIIVDQGFAVNTPIKSGTHVNVTLSAGHERGVIIPDLLGKSLSEAEKILADNKLMVGRINYQPSFSLLPNTVIDQYPSKGTQVQDSTSIDLFVTKNVSTPEE
jgi:serine/threonine-protein kinase